jgi:proteasome assembly chaperone (PAC2) family protein
MEGWPRLAVDSRYIPADNETMKFATLLLETMPELASPTIVVGLRGWGNALEVASAMATFMVDSLEGRAVGRIDSDACYRYDENRPEVRIEDGRLKSIHASGGSFFAVKSDSDQCDLLILVADEPSLNWQRFCEDLADLALNVDARGLISLGSMFDSVLHTDRMISAFTTGDEYAEIFTRYGVLPINYHGPSAIHTLILDACRKRGLPGASLWCHCPAYLQGITHHGMLIQLAKVLSDMVSVSLDTQKLESLWKALEIQIQELIADNPKLEGIVDQIRKKKRRGAIQNREKAENRQADVIRLKDFFDP